VTSARVANFVALAHLAAFLFACPRVSPQSLVVREMRIPIKGSGTKGLEALMVRPAEPGPHPLALLTHGTPRDPNDRPGMTALTLEPQAMEFARRGFTAVVVLRRGFGDSGGGYNEDAHGCSNPDYIGATRESAADLRASVAYLSTLPEIDASRMIAVGVSTGGLAVVALTADPPPGLVAAFSFAGGRGSHSPGQVCNPGALVNAFAYFGRRSRTPMLWVYSENDHFFSPQLAHRFYRAFTEAGGNAKFILARPFRRDGHGLFSFSGAPIWTPMVDSFLKDHGLVLRASLLPMPEPPPVDPPPGFPSGLLRDFRSYLILPPHKALAVSAHAHFGNAFGRRTEKEAGQKALETCKQNSPKNDRCKIVMLDNARP